MARASASATATRRRLALTVQSQGVPVPVERARLRRWVAAGLEADAQITVRFVERAESRALNRNYRGKDRATNVLTFAYSRAPAVQADIVICMPVVEREALAQRKSITAHLAHMVVHGVLHAQGYDHLDEVDARRMESREVAILRRFGIGDPYLAH
ncbi:MAG: rRNA maturation RNase YbeY [Burkholderiales bacterium]|nr:MAG: rRNA maturation RNase YbeY [Burkholderiales bacterium]